jgi:hypothetical protein
VSDSQSTSDEAGPDYNTFTSSSQHCDFKFRCDPSSTKRHAETNSETRIATQGSVQTERRAMSFPRERLIFTNRYFAPGTRYRLFQCQRRFELILSIIRDSTLVVDITIICQRSIRIPLHYFDPEPRLFVMQHPSQSHHSSSSHSVISFKRCDDVVPVGDCIIRRRLPRGRIGSKRFVIPLAILPSRRFGCSARDRRL